nr:unnamed protein product [Digitaria exilis]
MTLLTASSTTSLPTTISFGTAWYVRGSFTPTLTPIPSTSTAIFSFRNWSVKCGHVTTGSPAVMASSVEFHPQCVTNPPTAAWDRIVTCGAHPLTRRPRPSTRSSISRSAPRTASSYTSSAFLTTQMNGCPDASSPSPSSTTCLGPAWAMLPKLTYTTEPGPLPSSHRRHSAAPMAGVSLPLDACVVAPWWYNDTGPTVQTLNPRASSYPATYSGSISSTSPSSNHSGIGTLRRNPGACALVTTTFLSFSGRPGTTTGALLSSTPS